MDNKIIGRFIPVGKNNDWAKPFFVLTREPSEYLAPAWKGINVDGEKYHVIESAWEFEPIEWSGEGIPPVGCRVEVRADDFEGGWLVIDVVYVHNGEVVGIVQSQNEYLNDRLEKFSAGYNRAEFRPIRSEADKKRDKAVNEFVRQLIECVDLHAMDKRQEDIVREKLYSLLPTLPGVTVINQTAAMAVFYWR